MKLTNEQVVQRLGWVKEAISDVEDIELVMSCIHQGPEQGCGTAACVIGWAAVHPEFIKLGWGWAVAGLSYKDRMIIFGTFNTALGISTQEFDALSACNANDRRESARQCGLPGDLGHFDEEYTTVGNATEVIDLLIARYKNNEALAA